MAKEAYQVLDCVMISPRKKHVKSTISTQRVVSKFATVRKRAAKATKVSKERQSSANAQVKNPLTNTSTDTSTPQSSLNSLAKDIKAVDQKLTRVLRKIKSMQDEMSANRVERLDAVVVRQPPTEVSPPSATASSGLGRTILYFRGLDRRSVNQARQSLKTLGVPSQAVQFISFVGKEVAELIVLASLKEEVVAKLGAARITLDPNFNPLNPKHFGSTTFERLGLVGKSEAERVEAAKRAFALRMDSMLQTLAKGRHSLRSFLGSLKRAVEKGVPTERFFNPMLQPLPVLGTEKAGASGSTSRS